MTTTLDRIRQHLAPLTPTMLELEDESHRHAGHAGARSGGGHYFLTVVSPQFESQARLARHRQVFALLGPLMQTEIHALGITALTPDEHAARASSGT